LKSSDFRWEYSYTSPEENDVQHLDRNECECSIITVLCHERSNTIQFDDNFPFLHTSLCIP